MTQNQNTEPVNDPAGEESGTMKALRSQIKDLSNENKELKDRPSEEDIIAKYEAARQRTEAVENVLIAHDVPKGIAELVQDKLGESEATEESVVKILTDLGFDAEGTEGASEEAGEQQDPASDLAAVSNLSNQVQSAAQGASSDDLGRKIQEAETPEELAQIMAEADLTH